MANTKADDRVGITEKRRGRPSSRERILAAALELAHTVGAGNVSLDAVADRAGISKGGLLYHFPTKIQLLRALVAMHVERLEAQVADARTHHADRPNALIRAVIESSCLAEDGAKANPSGLLAAIAEDPLLIEPVREHMRHLVQGMRETCRVVDRALIALLAMEGLRTHDLFEFKALSSQERQRMMKSLADFVDDAGHE